MSLKQIYLPFVLTVFMILFVEVNHETQHVRCQPTGTLKNAVYMQISTESSSLERKI